MTKFDQERANSSSMRVYRPDARMGDTAWAALMHLIQEFFCFKSHISIMFAQEFRNSYHGTRLGIFWNFFLPLLPVSVYILLATFRVIPNFEGLPAALAISSNATCWYLFASGVQTPIGIVQQRNAEAMKTSLPLSASVAANFARVLFEMLVRSGLVAILAVIFQVLPAATAPLAIVVLATGFVFFVSLGHILAIINIVVPDIQRVVTVALQYGIFISGVIFPLSALDHLAIMQTINPFAVFITAAREALFTGSISQPLVLIAWAAGGLVMTLIAARIFYVMEQRIRGVV